MSEDATPDLPPIAEEQFPQRWPARVGADDVRQLDDAIRALRADDYSGGGGACRDAVLINLAWARGLLRLPTAGPVRDRLFTAVADLHNLAGWTAFDLGRIDEAHTHYQAALDLAGQCGHQELEANVRYRLGRLHLHRRAPSVALAEFARSWETADRVGSRHAAAIASANQAWSEAMRDDRAAAVRLLGRAQDEFSRADRADVPSWATFSEPRIYGR